jgi:hypothetical protein
VTEGQPEPADAPAAGARGRGARAGTGRRRGDAKAAPDGAAKSRQRTAEEARRHRARVRAAEAAVLKLERRLGEIDQEFADPDTYVESDGVSRLLDERAAVEKKLQAEYEAWSRLVDAGE